MKLKKVLIISHIFWFVLICGAGIYNGAGLAWFVACVIGSLFGYIAQCNDNRIHAFS